MGKTPLRALDIFLFLLSLRGGQKEQNSPSVLGLSLKPESREKLLRARRCFRVRNGVSRLSVHHGHSFHSLDQRRHDSLRSLHFTVDLVKEPI